MRKIVNLLPSNIKNYLIRMGKEFLKICREGFDDSTLVSVMLIIIRDVCDKIEFLSIGGHFMRMGSIVITFLKPFHLESLFPINFLSFLNFMKLSFEGQPSLRIRFRKRTKLFFTVKQQDLIKEV